MTEPGAVLSGGFYISRFEPRSTHQSPKLLPNRLLSASGCICSFFPDPWAIEWTNECRADRVKEPENMGIPEDRLPEVIAWATGNFSKTFGWPNVFYELDDAREARARFFGSNPDVVVFGLGLHDSKAGAFLEFAAPGPPRPGFAPMGETGIYESVKKRRRIPSGGEQLGFELLTTYLGLLSCSWLCNGLEIREREIGIAPNRHGFIATHEAASRCAEFIGRPNTGAEPGLWLPWLVTLYQG